MKTLIPSLLSLMLMAGQAIYFSASASSNQEPSSGLLAMSQPSTAGIKESQTIVQEQISLTDDKIGFLWGMRIGASHFGKDKANRLAKEGIVIGNDSGNNYVDLDSGNILLTPEKDTVVGTHAGKIYIGAGAIVFIAESGDDVILYDLLQTKPKQVYVTASINKQKVILEPGRMLVLSRQNTNDFEKLEMKCHCVAYCNAKPLDLHNNGVKAFEADFSIASALLTIQPLKALTASDNKQNQLVVERLVKGAVIMGDFATSTAALAQIVNAATTAQADGATPVQVADIGQK